MAKLTEQDKKRYQDQIQFYKKRIEDLTNDIKKIRQNSSMNKAIQEIEASKLYLSIITIYCGMNEISVDQLEIKNISYIDKARQIMYEVLINLGNVFTNYLDVPFSEYAEKVQLIQSMSDKEILTFLRYIGYCNDLIKESYGDNTKWKWAFVDMDGRYAIICKNTFDLKKFQKLDQPQEEGYRDRRQHLYLIQRTLSAASHAYREKYELSTKDIEDLKKAIDFQKALLRINNVIGDTEKIENNKKQIEVWQTLLDKHLQEIENKKKK